MIVGKQGDDVLEGGGGTDVLLGGAGDDTLKVSDGTFIKVDGDTGQDVLFIDDGADLDFSTIDNLRTQSIEEIDFDG